MGADHVANRHRTRPCRAEEIKPCARSDDRIKSETLHVGVTMGKATHTIGIIEDVGTLGVTRYVWALCETLV
jgi:hypothetical protein